MKKTVKVLTVTFAAVVMALFFGTTANAGGPHMSLDIRLPLPPLPPIPVPFGFVDVNGPAYGYAPRLYTPGYVFEYDYRPVYREAYRPHYRHYRYERHVRRDWRRDRWRDHDRGRRYRR